MVLGLSAATAGTASAIAAGAFVGGVGRHLLAGRPGGWLGTGCANVLACALLGLAPAVGSPLLLAALSTGCAGALSTWSTLAGELGGAVEHSHQEKHGRSQALARPARYLLLTLLAGTLAYAAGAAAAAHWG